MLAVLTGIDGRVVGNGDAPRSGERRRGDGDAFQFAKEIAGTRRLVVAAHLPYHCIAVLMVVPKGIVAPLCCRRRRVNADVAIGGAHDDFLAPVAENVALEAGRPLCVVIGQGA